MVLTVHVRAKHSLRQALGQCRRAEKRASSEIANQRKTAGKDKRKDCKHLLKYTSIHPLPKKTVLVSECQIAKRCGV